MRWFAAFLLVANLIVALWITQTGGWLNDQQSTLRSSIGEIRLVSQEELDQSACYSAGPFSSLEMVKQIAIAVDREGLKSEISRNSGDQQVLFQLVLSPSGAAVQALLTSLSSDGVKDAWLITEGVNRNRISLGVFREKNNALLRQSQLEALGYSSRLVEKLPDNDGYLLVVRRETSEPIEENLLTRLAGLAGGQPFQFFSCEKIVPVE